MSIDTSLPLPADTDIERILEDGHLAELAALIHTYNIVAVERRELARPGGRSDGEPLPNGSTELAPVTALHALRATEAARQRLDDGRYQMMRDARADGQSWSAIGAALGMSKQGAMDWHNKRSIPMFQDHDAE